MVQAGIDGGALFLRGPLEREAIEFVIPLRTQRGTHGIEVPARNLVFQVFTSLIDAQKRGANADLDDLALRGIEPRVGSRRALGLAAVGP